MKNTVAQLQLFVAKIDRRYIQLAYCAFLLAGFFLRAPSDGGGGPY